MIKAIIFDLGGVITNIDKISESYKILCKKYNFNGESPWKDFREEWNKTKINELSCQDFFKIISKRSGMDIKEIQQAFSNVEVDEKMKELIINLKNNYKIGILSNIIEYLLNIVLSKWNFLEMAEAVTSCNDGVKKPDTKAIDLILKKLNLTKEEVIFVDDSKKTVQIYSDYGVKSIRFENQEQLIRELNKEGVATLQ
jgi:putative hydrolase of the HAD superfamily